MAFVLETPEARKLLLPSAAAITRTLSDAGLGFDMDGARRFLSPPWELIKVKATTFFNDHLAKKADEVLLLPAPVIRSETIEQEQWLRAAVTVVLPTLVLLCVARWCCARGRGGLMMAAPGRRGARMPRGAFEVSPRSYFRDLRANKPLAFVH